MSNPVRAMISRLQTMITTMAALGDDPLILTYFVDAVDVLVEDIRDEVLEVVNAYIPTEGIPEEEEEEEEEDVIPTQSIPSGDTQTGSGDTQTQGEGTQTQGEGTQTPAEDPPAETPVGSEDEDPPVEDPPADP
jgi:hypothetical protein